MKGIKNANFINNVVRGQKKIIQQWFLEKYNINVICSVKVEQNEEKIIQTFLITFPSYGDLKFKIKLSDIKERKIKLIYKTIKIEKFDNLEEVFTCIMSYINEIPKTYDEIIMKNMIEKTN